MSTLTLTFATYNQSVEYLHIYSGLVLPPQGAIAAAPVVITELFLSDNKTLK